MARWVQGLVDEAQGRVGHLHDRCPSLVHAGQLVHRVGRVFGQPLAVFAGGHVHLLLLAGRGHATGCQGHPSALISSSQWVRTVLTMSPMVSGVQAQGSTVIGVPAARPCAPRRSSGCLPRAAASALRHVLAKVQSTRWYSSPSSTFSGSSTRRLRMPTSSCGGQPHRLATSRPISDGHAPVLAGQHLRSGVAGGRARHQRLGIQLISGPGRLHWKCSPASKSPSHRWNRSRRRCLPRLRLVHIASANEAPIAVPARTRCAGGRHRCPEAGGRRSSAAGQHADVLEAHQVHGAVHAGDLSPPTAL